MAKFLKISNAVLNTRYIQHIELNKGQYVIHLASPNIHGAMFFGSGGLSTDHTTYTVNEKKSPEAYKNVSTWITSVDQQGPQDRLQSILQGPQDRLQSILQGPQDRLQGLLQDAKDRLQELRRSKDRKQDPPPLPT